MKYALIKNNKVELISYEPVEGFVEVNDNVFADMILKPNGSFDYTDDFKLKYQISEFDRAMSSLRQKRNKLLADTDYLVLPDSTLTPQKKSEWMTYRTNLRNLTQGLTTVEQINNVAYPLKPQK